ncbi:MAG: PIN domain-containing protein [Chloroflexi bacterium]|nr:MAG: PIN domain-containing protein [Chloroflexota bacterium]
MILYLDASALVKRYVAEPGSTEVSAAISQAEATGTALVSRAEVAAALAKAVRVDALTQEEAAAGLQVFRNEWAALVRVQVTEIVVARADTLAWDHGLRGYDAVHLAAASVWQDALGERVTLATFDKRLWTAAGAIGLDAYPANLPVMLEAWKATR